ncbi:MAG: hypothetical protein ABII71_05580 [Candidatus Micrarchaeota archaeon]
MRGLSNILKGFLVLVLILVVAAAAMLFMGPGPAPVPEPDPFADRLDDLNERIYQAGSAASVGSLRSEVGQLEGEITASGKYPQYLTLTDAQLMTLNVVELYFEYIDQATAYGAQGVDCSKDYTSLIEDMEGASSDATAAGSKVNSYLADYPDSSASMLKDKLASVDATGMAVFAGMIERDIDMNCPSMEKPSKSYALPLSEEDAVDLVVTDVVGSNDWYAYSPGPDPLPSGTLISSNRGDEFFNQTLTKDSWFFFVDTDPLMPFGHQAYYVLIDAATSQYQVYDEEWFPVINGLSYFSTIDERMNAAWRVYPAKSEGNLTYDFSEPLGSFYRLEYNALAIANVPLGTQVPFDEDLCCVGVGTKRALVVTGYDEPMFRGDTANVYSFLKGQGFTDGNINYLTAQAGEANSDGQTTMNRLVAGLDALARDAQCCDEVFIYISGHGMSYQMHEYRHKTTGETTWVTGVGALTGGVANWEATGASKKLHRVTINPRFTTPAPVPPGGAPIDHGSADGGHAWDIGFENKLDNIKSCYLTFMYFSCHSGVAAPNLAGKGRTVITPVGDNPAWGLTGSWQDMKAGGIFTQYYIQGRSNESLKDEVDTNDDGSVTDKEAFDWAKRKAKDFVQTKLNDTNDATWTEPLPCRCCHVVCNETTAYMCIVIEPDGTDCEDCEFVGDYCGPEDVIIPPDDWVDPGDGEGVVVGGGEGVPPDGGDGGAAPVCGDGAITGGEQCDHGSYSTNKCPEGKYCKDCQCKDLETSVVCGDGKISSPMEDCDGGNVLYNICPEGQQCRICKCVGETTQCGDGSIGGQEECDHGNSVTVRCEGGNVCYNCRCVPPGEVPEGEEPPEYQHLECHNEACVLVDGYGGDECSSNADCQEEVQPECGDGDVNGNEECESDNDCPSGMNCYECHCSEEEPENDCGDEVVEGWEECEFDSDCYEGEVCLGCLCYDVPAYCGDGMVDSGEQCDPKANPNGCGSGGVCSGGCRCVYPPELDCAEICSATPGAVVIPGAYGSSSECGAAAESYFDSPTCYLTCKYSWFYAVSNIAGQSSCCCGYVKRFPCSDCPGSNPVCPGESKCTAEAPTWYVPP